MATDKTKKRKTDLSAQACMKKKSAKALENVDEQGERANVRQNTPPKGLRNKR
jgi:hypothetical protein